MLLFSAVKRLRRKKRDFPEHKDKICSNNKRQDSDSNFAPFKLRTNKPLRLPIRWPNPLRPDNDISKFVVCLFVLSFSSASNFIGPLVSA